MPRAAIYARRSSDAEDRQVQSLPAQLHWARDVCSRFGIVDPLVFEERRSAKMPGRPEFNRLLGLVQKGEVDTIIAWKADRLARNALDGGSVLYALEAKKLIRIITSDRTYSGQPDEEFILHLELGLSAKYSKDLSKNVQRGLRDKWRRGEWAGLAPLGYLNVREGKDHGVIAVDEQTAPHVRRLFELAASGNYSLLRLATVAANDWRLDLVRRRRANAPRRGIPLATIHRVLTNPFYYGAMRVKGELHAGTHVPLVSKAVFDRVQAVLSNRRTGAERPQKRSFAFVGLTRCGRCGRRLTAYAKSKPSGRSYTYYVCTNRLKKRCTEAQVAERELDTAATAAIGRLQVSRDDKDLCLRIVGELAEQRLADVDAHRKRLQIEIATFDQQNERLLDLLLTSTVTQDDYQRKRAELSERRTEAQLTLDAAYVRVEERLELARTYLSALPEDVSFFSTCTPDEKKTYLRNLGLELVATEKQVHVDAEKPTSILLDRSAVPVWRAVIQDVLNYFLETSTDLERPMWPLSSSRTMAR